MPQVFVSYSRADETTVRTLVERLQADGIQTWFDRHQLRPGQIRDDEIKKAVRESRAVIVCLSSNWVNAKDDVQADFRFILDEAKRQPYGAVWMVPVTLDEDVVLPAPLRDIHSLYLDGDGAYRILLDTLRDVAGTPQGNEVKNTNARSASTFEEFFEEMIERGAVVHIDSWKTASSKEELAFKELLRNRMDAGMQALLAQDWARVLEVWQPLRDDELFDATHRTWSGKPYFGAQVLSGQMQVFVALVQLRLPKVREAFEELQRLIRQPPYSMKGASAERLATSDARTFNLNYKTVLRLAEEWLGEVWSPTMFEAMFDIPQDVYEDAQHDVESRLREIDFLLERYPEPE